MPNYAWSWLQRSRPVLIEAARRLTGGPPPPGFVDRLREDVGRDPFTRDVLIDVVADVAFNGRVPRHRPPGASWDRGLTWWAAAIAGTTPAEFDATGPPPAQSRLFGEEDAAPAPQRRSGRRSTDRAAVVAALRDLVRTAEDGRVPAAAVEALIAQLEGGKGAPGATSRGQR